MPLTPADVHNVAFSKPPIGKRGYNEDEVDAFLDLVEQELSRLIEENADLRQRVGELDRSSPMRRRLRGSGSRSADSRPQGGAGSRGRAAQGSAPAPAPAAAAAAVRPGADANMQAAKVLGSRPGDGGPPHRATRRRSPSSCSPTRAPTRSSWSATHAPVPRR